MPSSREGVHMVQVRILSHLEKDLGLQQWFRVYEGPTSTPTPPPRSLTSEPKSSAPDAQHC